MSFVGDFVSYLQTRTDAPKDFFIHAALCCLSTALGNQVCCNGWSRDIYPNLWAIIIANSGSGKSVALDFADDLITMAGLSDRKLPQSFSYEAVVNAIASQPVGIFIQQEFAAFLSVINKEYNAGCDYFLTEVYDCPRSIKRILMAKTVEIALPSVTILAASSPDWFSQSFKSSQLRGGFLARFVFCPSEEYGQYVGDPPARDDRIETALADHLRRAAELRGRFDFSGVSDMFTEWDRAQRLRMRESPSPEFHGIRARSGALAKKAAMLAHVSNTTRNLRITEEDMRFGIRYVEHNQRLAEGYLTDRVAHGRDDQDCLTVLEKVRSQGGHAPRSWVLRYSHLSSPALDRAQRTLVESGRLVVRREEDKKQWFCLPEWVATPIHTGLVNRV